MEDEEEDEEEEDEEDDDADEEDDDDERETLLELLPVMFENCSSEFSNKLLCGGMWCIINGVGNETASATVEVAKTRPDLVCTKSVLIANLAWPLRD